MACVAIAAALLAIHFTARANPTGGQVVEGAAVIAGQGTPNVTVTQASQRALINWDSFVIGTGEQVNFVQPNASAVALNRMLETYTPRNSGTLNANGIVALVNPNTIIQGGGQSIDAAALATASRRATRTRPMITAKPESAWQRFVTSGHSKSAHNAGIAGFVSPIARNARLLAADIGSTKEGTGSGVTLDLYGDGLVSFELGHGLAHDLMGNKLTNDGMIVLTSDTARGVVNQSVNARGIYLLQTVTQKKDGKITIARDKSVR